MITMLILLALSLLTGLIIYKAKIGFVILAAVIYAALLVYGLRFILTQEGVL